MAKKARRPKTINPEIRQLKLSKLKPSDYNPRTINDDALAGLAASIRKFGCVEPIVVNVRGGKNRIVGGHQRYKVLCEKHAPGTEVLCVTVDLADANEKLLNLTLNNPGCQGQFITSLGEYIDKLREGIKPADYVGLRIDQLRATLGNLPEKVGKTNDDDIPKPPKKAVTRTGDLWQLGKHRLLCGDSTKEKHVARLMKGQKASLFATDPPYCVDYTGDDRPHRGKDWSGLYHEVGITDVGAFMRAFYRIGLKFIKRNTALYLWHASSRRAEIGEVCKELNILIHQQIIWVKPCIVLGFSFYGWRHEPCLLMWVKGSKPHHRPKNKTVNGVWPVGYVKSGDPNTPEYYTDVWELDWAGKKRSHAGIEHPTVKPVEIFAIPMRIHTKEDDICYEPFCGSGSQIIAAEKLGRRCFAMELEPVFCDVAVKRWEDWTGKKARKVKG